MDQPPHGANHLQGEASGSGAVSQVRPLDPLHTSVTQSRCQSVQDGDNEQDVVSDSCSRITGSFSTRYCSEEWICRAGPGRRGRMMLAVMKAQFFHGKA
ncbi:unnamed protein product [Pleuronectes platessa]|uniref:Uncharacterized protein n=1 Tax=Pleuronectes platessa TaxID=8262 RepID=A0A9N7UUF9_PLEPL|nr:unnamed protein product [Pleuronectes platessa]